MQRNVAKVIAGQETGQNDSMIAALKTALKA